MAIAETVETVRIAPRPSAELDFDLAQRVAFLQELRAGIDRAALGLSTRPKSRGLTQREVVTALGDPVGERQWRNLERCEQPWPRPIADAYARLLSLEGQELRVFYTIVGQRRAGMSPGGELTEAEKFMLSRVFARCAPWYIVDELWDIRACNTAMTVMVPQLIPGMNVLEFVLTHPNAKRQCLDWYDKWATPMVHQLRSTLSSSTGARRTGLMAVAREVCSADQRIADAWTQKLDARLSPNGDRRMLRPADPEAPDGLGPAMEIVLYGMAPLNRPDWRAMWVFPVDHTCEQCRPANYADGERWFPEIVTAS